MKTQPNFDKHRQRVLSQLADDEAVLVFGSAHPFRNGDAEYPYRPDSMLYWLTGWPDPEVAVFLRPGEQPFTLFCQESDPKIEIWTGYRPGLEGAKERFGADAAEPFGSLPAELPKLLKGVSTLHYGFGHDADNDAIVMGSIHKASRAARHEGDSIPETFLSPTRMLHELRLRKEEDEIATLRHSAHITEQAFRAAMAHTKPGMFEFEIEGLLLGHFRRMGSNGPGYTSIVAGGNNATTLHYIDNNQALRDGDLLLIDAGAEFCFYTSDVTRTFPTNGTFSKAQRAVYQAVLDAQLAAINTIAPGESFKGVHEAAVHSLTTSMVELGLLEGSVEELIEEKAFKKYYMHGTSHWLGLDVHDVGLYGRGGQSRILEPGMVLTVEPGLYIAQNDEDAPPELRGIGVRIEDDVLVTAAGHDVLSAGIPKTIKEVEDACRAPEVG